MSPKKQAVADDGKTKPISTPIAIIGMSSIFPMARNTQEFWDNLLQKIDCLTEVPPSRWNAEDYFDPDPSKPDKTYCKRGGFIPDIDFDPMEFGLPPNILEVTDVSQLLSLVVARDAIEDAGYNEERDFDRENTGVILGVVGISSKLFTPLMSRLQYPVWEKVLLNCGISREDTQKIIEKIKLAYVGWEENSFPGTILNVIAGRIANRLDLGGTNCVVDAACGSSLSAVKMAIGELVERRANVMITGGVDTDNSIGTYLCFSKTPAFSKSQMVRPFDSESDGMMVGEGIGMFVMKRLEDAERDGDRIYAVIRGVGSSSDGRFKSIYAPRPEGQARALRRAYEDAGFSPATVGLMEAHGTGTPAGDPAEVASMKDVFGENNPRKGYIALGSVKSQIAHTKAAAGAASLMKIALALHHKILPATINVTKPSPKLGLEDSPFYLNTEVRPWIRAEGEPPRRAAVSSFGFGGTNFHMVLEEYTPEHKTAYRINTVPRMILLHASSPSQLLENSRQTLERLKGQAAQSEFLQLAEISENAEIPIIAARIGFIAATVEEARDLLQAAIDALKDKLQEEAWEHPRGIYYRKTGMVTDGKIVALFAGQGSQYPDMGREMALNFPPLREIYARMDALFAREGLKPVSEVVFPPPAFDPAEKERQAEALQQTSYAQPAIGSFSLAQYKILTQAGFKPDFTAGHSFGELTALCAAGVIDEDAYLTLAKARGKAMAPPPDPNFDAGTMLAVKGDISTLPELLKEYPEVTLANFNSTQQVVLAGSKPAIAAIQPALSQKGYSVVPLSVSAAFHTPLVGHAQKPFAGAIQKEKFSKPAIPVYSNTTGKRHPDDPQAIQKALTEHILNPVQFKDEIDAIYAEGGSIFVEFGPKNVLTNLVKTILGNRSHLAIALNANAKKDSDRQFRDAVLQLRVAGLTLKQVDPYGLPARLPKAKKKGSINVTLNGGLYISEKTRKAFENALQDGFKVKSAVPPSSNEDNGRRPEAVPTPAQLVPAPSQPVAAQAATFLTARVSGPETAAMGSTVVEKSIAEFQAHQNETLKVHEEYLRSQSEYTRTFADLMQMGYNMFQNPAAQSGGIENAVRVMESIERSLARFHEHQSETLRVHEQYLKNQTDFTQAILSLLQNQAATSKPQAQTAMPAPAGIPAAIQAAPVFPQPVLEPVLLVSTSSDGNGTNVKAESQMEVNRASQPATPEPAQAVQASTIPVEAITAALLEVVSEKTGYPQEMLEMGMDMEADLGIDSIKRVEILGAMQNRFPELPKVDTSALAETRTLGQITTLLSESLPQGRTSAPSPQPASSAPDAAPVSPDAQATAFINVDQISSALLDVVSEKTGYPQEMLEMGMDMEADLGIDSIKRVEILGAMQNRFPEMPRVDAAAFAEIRTLGQIITHLSESLSAAGIPAIEQPQATQAAASSPAQTATTEASDTQNGEKEIATALLEVVSEKTGYPQEMLEMGMDMEADLGIDSIKRVEILGGIQTRFPELPKIEADILAETRTLGQIIDVYRNQAATAPAQMTAQPEQALSPAPAIAQGTVELKPLPPPDQLESTLPEGYSCIVTNDGSPATANLVRQLSQRGWKVAVLNFPSNLIANDTSLPSQIHQVHLEDTSETALQQALVKLARTFGPVGAFIHLNPVVKTSTTHLFSEKSEQIMEQIFLAARFLKDSLNEAARAGKSAFMAVTRIDGQFGLSQRTEADPIQSGLFGLVKSLGLEWENVFCRAIDLSPDLSPEDSARAILAELDDPNRLISEVAYGPRGRVTRVVVPASA
ncbi:MAG TPA: beta-ketoacyl synthase N-terminal-like domain-containing protein [Anaerolineaceae bacterium]|nr:beta-ketoacyl synthase N-terminal-like domain-containing protein [Anaerolineaceae bacterium]